MKFTCALIFCEVQYHLHNETFFFQNGQTTQQGPPQPGPTQYGQRQPYQQQYQQQPPYQQQQLSYQGPPQQGPTQYGQRQPYQQQYPQQAPYQQQYQQRPQMPYQPRGSQPYQPYPQQHGPPQSYQPQQQYYQQMPGMLHLCSGTALVCSELLQELLVMLSAVVVGSKLLIPQYLPFVLMMTSFS